MLRTAAALFFALATFLPASVPAAAPQYRPVKAQLLQARMGLGNVFAKLEAGGEVRVAYLGGSITAAGGWRVKSLAWLQKEFPKAKVSEINAAIGGTGSDLGVYRLEHDVLRHRPDLMFVEFSVNDGGAAPENIWRAMEGTVRQTWAANPETDICFVYTFRSGYEVDLQQGLCPRAAGADEMLAEHYGIPSLNFALKIAELHQQQKLVIQAPDQNSVPAGVTLFSTDGVHPLDAGHELYQQVLADAFRSLRQQQTRPRHGEKLASSFIADHWQAARMVPLDRALVSEGWKQYGPQEGPFKHFGNRMDSLWEATQPGAQLRFRFRGTAVKLYDLLGPDGGQVQITVDGKSRGPVPRFDSYCSYHRLATLWIADDLPAGEHTVTVTVLPEQPDRRSVTDKEKLKPGFDPKKYDGTCLRVGGILLLGELVK